MVIYFRIVLRAINGLESSYKIIVVAIEIVYQGQGTITYLLN